MTFLILQMLRSFVVLALAVLTLGEVNYDELTEEIANTKQLINLYNKKLLLLEEIYHENYPNIQYPQPSKQSQNITNKNNSKTARLNQKLILLKKLQLATIYAPGGYLINNNKIIDVNSFEELGQFIGDLLVAQPDKLTTLLVGKLGITEIKKQQKILEKHQYLTGQSGELMSSIWHRNLNIKDAQDVLIQWDNKKLVFLGKQKKQVFFEQGQQPLKVYSLNQYKAILVTNQRVAIINRLQQLTDSNFARNFSRSGESQPKIVSADYSDNTLLVLLNTGQIARLASQKMVVSQTILNAKYDFQLSQGSVFMQSLENKLFVIHKTLGLVKIFNFVSGRFILNINMHLPSLQSLEKNFQLFKSNGSVRLIASTERQSYIYELLLPVPEESSYTPSYLKVLGVLAAIGCFIFFKMKKDDNSQKPELGRPGAKRVNYSPQIQQYLKKTGTGRQQPHKQKKN